MPENDHICHTTDKARLTQNYPWLTFNLGHNKRTKAFNGERSGTSPACLVPAAAAGTEVACAVGFR